MKQANPLQEARAKASAVYSSKPSHPLTAPQRADDASGAEADDEKEEEGEEKKQDGTPLSSSSPDTIDQDERAEFEKIRAAAERYERVRGELHRAIP